MSITHALIAPAGVSLILSTADPLVLGLAVLGSQLPDLDTSTSLIGQIFFPLSHWIEDRFPRRSYQEYVASVNAAERVEQYNQAQLKYQRQLAEYEQRIRDKQFQTAQFQTRLDDVDNALPRCDSRDEV